MNVQALYYLGAYFWGFFLSQEIKPHKRQWIFTNKKAIKKFLLLSKKTREIPSKLFLKERPSVNEIIFVSDIFSLS